MIKTFDFAEGLHPDILGDLVQNSKLATENFDVILCCQILEHMRYEESLFVLSRMQEISRYLIISDPYKAITIRGTLKIPLLKEHEFSIKVPIGAEERQAWSIPDIIGNLESVSQ
jgi:hypothetical protein